MGENSRLLLLLKYTNSKWKSLKEMNIYYVQAFQKIFQLIIWKRLDFLVDYDSIDVSNVLDIQKYMMEKYVK